MRTWQRNAKIVFPIVIVQTIVYVTINHFPMFPPCELSLTEIDHAMPFWPWTLWLYFGFILGQIGMALMVRDAALFRQALVAYGIAMSLTLVVHFLWPTCIVRPDPVADGTFHTWAYRLVLACDAPNSCFPSAHICGPVVIFWAYWRDSRPLGAWLLFLALPILTLSILTTKQHYLWDWIGGWAMGGLAIGVSYLFTSRNAELERQRRA